MRVTVYLWAKLGEEVFASGRCPSKDRIFALKKEGWQFFSTDIFLPVEGEEEIRQSDVGIMGMKELE